MDKKTLTRDEALDTVRAYKQVIRSRYRTEPRVVMYGSYAKGYANPDSDIDVAVILPESDITDRWEQMADLWSDSIEIIGNRFEHPHLMRSIAHDDRKAG